MDIPPTAAAALCDDLRLIAGEVRKNASGLGFLDQSAPRHADDEILAALAIAARTAAIFPTRGYIFALIAEIRQGGEVVVHLEDNIAALSAVAAVRPAGGHILFPMERNGSIAAFACFDGDFCMVDKHRVSLPSYWAARWTA